MALVITIIVLIILAGVSINAVMNQGLIMNAKDASTKYDEEKCREEIQLEILSSYNNDGEIDFDKLREKIEAKGGTLSEDNTTINYNGYKFTINENGDITVYTDEWTGEIDTAWYYDNEGQTEYTISTPEELAGLAEIVNSGVNFADVVINLDSDLNLGKKQWTPIGTVENPFSGQFVCNDYVITGLYINNNTLYQAGLFGILNDKEEAVQNRMSISAIVKDSEIIAPNASAGAICGHVEGGEGNIWGISINNKINASTAGGIVGSFANIWTGSQFYIRGYNTSTVNGTGNAGGIVGNVMDVENDAYAHVAYAQNDGHIIGENAGGIIGSVTGTNRTNFYTCINRGKVEGLDSAGGIIGALTSTCTYTLASCLDIGEIVDTAQIAGGIIGDFASGNVSNCYSQNVAFGQIDESSATYSDVEGEATVDRLKSEEVLSNLNGVDSDFIQGEDGYPVIANIVEYL